MDEPTKGAQEQNTHPTGHRSHNLCQQIQPCAVIGWVPVLHLNLCLLIGHHQPPCFLIGLNYPFCWRMLGKILTNPLIQDSLDWNKTNINTDEVLNYNLSPLAVIIKNIMLQFTSIYLQLLPFQELES